MTVMRSIIYVFLFLLWTVQTLEAQQTQLQEVNIGAIFYEEEADLQRSFEASVARVNNERRRKFKLRPLIRRVKDTGGSIELQANACDLIDNNVAAIFGPSSKAESDIVSLICNSTGIPHIQFDKATEETVEEKLNHRMTLNVYPSLLILSKAYSDIVQNFNWRKFTIVYNEDDLQAPSRLQDLLQLRDLHDDVVRVRRFKRDSDYRILWKSIKGERRVVLDCPPDILVEVLNASIPFDMTGEFNHLFLTNLESHSSNIELLRDNVTFGVNVTAARLQLNGNIYNANVWQRAQLYDYDPNTEDSTALRTLLPDLVYDAVNLFTLALRNVTLTYPYFKAPRVKCDFRQAGSGQTWAMGPYIMDIMKTTSGVNNTNFRTTNLQFDDDGNRVNFDIEIFEPLDNYGIAVWDTKGQITPLHVEASVAKRIVYRVATRFGLPYFAEDPIATEQNVTGNERYMGYAVDLIQALSEELGFEYIFEPVKDNAYGRYNKETKQWNGIIGELINNNAHMGICDLTITQARKTVVDFTVPFMQLGISLLAYKEQKEPTGVLAFLGPFQNEVWIYVLFATFVMSFLFKLVARISQAEWENPHPCNKDPEVLENQWHFHNSLWLTMGSIMTAGSDILPKSAPMRTVNAMWWIFAIIVANSYTANLAAFLTNEQMESDIKDLKSLVEQSQVKFGTMAGGSTYTFFSESNETIYRLAYNIMDAEDPSSYTRDNNEGVERVLKNQGDYMFLMETTTIEYNIERNCALRMVGEKFSEKHYAIAVPIGAEYRSSLSVGILKLSERGELFKLKNKWWRNETRDCDEAEESETDTPAMTFEQVRGIFYTLYVGLFVAMLIGVGEFLLYTQNVAVEERSTFKEALAKEVKFVLCIWNNKKPITCTPSNSLGSASHRSSKQTAQKSCEELVDLKVGIDRKNGDLIQEANV